MPTALNQNRHFLIIVATALLFGLIVFMFSEYYAYSLPFVLGLSLAAIFLEKLKKNTNFLIWSCLFFSIFLGGTRTFEDILLQTVDPIRIIRIVLLVTIFLVMMFRMLFTKFAGLDFSLRSPLGWFLVYAIIAMISSAYSAQFFVSLWKGFELLVFVVGAMFVQRSLRSFKDTEKFWALNIFFIGLLVGSAYLSAIISPSEAFKEVRGGSFSLLEGVYPSINSNSLAQMAAILIAIFAVRSLHAGIRRRYLTLAFLTLPALILSYGRTSILALFVALVIVFVLIKQYRYLFFLAMTALLVFWVDGYSYIELLFQKGGTLKTLSGRLIYWPTAWTLLKASPIYGYGFYVASRVVFSEEVGTESFSTTDNTYFDVLLSVGIIGFIPFAFVLYTFTKKLFKNWSSPRNTEVMRLKYEILCVAIIIFFRSLTGPSIQILHWNLPIFLALIICLQSIKKFESTLSPQSS